MSALRNLYAKETGVEVPDGFEIHHLDLNRKNNVIENMVALPTQLHRSYHMTLPTFDGLLPIEEMFMPAGGITGTNNKFGFVLDMLQKHYPFFSEVQDWIMYRDSLRGLIFNFSNVSYP